jgi:hypothetical protein
MTKQEVIAPDREVEREKKSEKEEGGMADVMNLLSMVAGGVGMMMRVRGSESGWLADVSIPFFSPSFLLFVGMAYVLALFLFLRW